MTNLIKYIFKYNKKEMMFLRICLRPGWEYIGTAVELCTWFLSVFPQGCGEFHTKQIVFRPALQKLYWLRHKHWSNNERMNE